MILQTSHVRGTQSINRGELESAAWVSEFFSRRSHGLSLTYTPTPPSLLTLSMPLLSKRSTPEHIIWRITTWFNVFVTHGTLFMFAQLKLNHKDRLTALTRLQTYIQYWVTLWLMKQLKSPINKTYVCFKPHKPFFNIPKHRSRHCFTQKSI